MEEEDEKLKKTYVVKDNGSGHATWMVEGSKMSEEFRHLRIPKTHKIRQEEGEQVSQRTHSISRE